MEAPHQGQEPLAGKRLPHFPDDVVRSAVGTAVEDHKALVRLDYQALLVGVVVRFQLSAARDVHFIGLPIGGQSGGLVGDQPDPLRRGEVSLHKRHPVSKPLHHRLGDAAVGHLPVLQHIAGVTAGAHVEPCLRHCLKKGLHAIGVVRVAVGEYGVIHPGQVDAQPFCVFQKQPGRAGVQQNLRSPVDNVDAESPLAVQSVPGDVIG